MPAHIGRVERPNEQDHATIRDWMAKHFGTGPVQHDDHVLEWYAYRAEREEGAYFLDVSQEAFDDEAAGEIVATLDRRGVATMMLADPSLRFLYKVGGEVVASPRAHPRGPA